MNRLVTTILPVALLLATFTIAPFGVAADAPPPVRFGMSAGAVEAQTAAGVAPDYGTFWIGPWTLKSGWGGPETQMRNLNNAGVTPAVHFYYWGDDISPSCVENGCWSDLHNAQKDQAGWDQLAKGFVAAMNKTMGGKPVVVFMETEFNKGGISSYEPFDGYLAAKALFIKTHYPNAQIVMALGNWNSGAWGTFDRTAAASDYVGLQGMRGSTRDSRTSYDNLYDATLNGVRTAGQLFGKPIFITDIALSSYPEPEYVQPQADSLQRFFTGLGELKAAGVGAIVYRSWADTPTMDLKNYYGQAERHWGLAYSHSGPIKPAGDVWIQGVQNERAGKVTHPGGALAVGDGLTTEAESFSVKTTGGRINDGQASGGAAWNVWSNGYVQQYFTVDQAKEYDITVRARGTTLGGIAPQMVVSVNGTAHITAYPAGAYGDYTARVTLAEAAMLRIAFTNDARSNTEDRNLIVDRVSITPANHAPTAAFTTAVDGLTVAVDASASSDLDGDSLTHRWDFGDGTIKSGAQQSHTYAQDGSYTIALAVDDGAAATHANRTIEVARPNQAPAAHFDASTQDLTVTLDAVRSTDPDGDALTFAWHLGDGRTTTGTRIEHTYATPGSYTVTLEVRDGRTANTTAQTLQVQRAAFTAAFTLSPNVNEWWVEARVDANRDLTLVEASVDGRPWTKLEPTSWGTYAKSMRVPAGSSVVLRATDIHGDQAQSPSHRWMEGKEPPKPTPMTAEFHPSPNGNAWWVEIGVTSTNPAVTVEARVNDGPWTALRETSWGTWAKSMQAPRGSTVTFRATDTHGQTATSAPVTWLGPAFTATFTAKSQGNDWWIESSVKASEKVSRVEARINGGPWTDLSATRWGTWAKSLHAPNGSHVEFRATGASGATATSSTYLWN